MAVMHPPRLPSRLCNFIWQLKKEDIADPNFGYLQVPPKADVVAFSDHPLVVTRVPWSTSFKAASCQLVNRRYLKINGNISFNALVYRLHILNG